MENFEGTLDYGAFKLRLILKLSKAVDDSYKATLISLDQGNKAFPIESLTFTDSFVHFDLPEIEASFTGGLSRDGSEIAGRWRQGNELLLIFRRADKEFMPKPVNTTNRRHGRVLFEPCNQAKLPKDAECGKYEVFEDRAAKAGRKIALNIVLLPAIGAKPAADPVFYFAGGPGGGAAAMVSNAGDFLTHVRRNRDIVFIDQRGTGKSNPLICNVFGDKTDMKGYFTEGFTPDKIAECKAQLEKIANLAFYDSSNGMADIDEVREAMGYGKINLLGGSYGSTAAMIFMRQHPNSVRAVAIEGVAPVNYKVPLPFAKGVQQAVDRAFADCAKQEDCHKAFPNLSNEFTELLSRLEKAPITFQTINYLTKKPQEVTMSLNGFKEHVRTLLYTPDATRFFPVLIHQAAQGNFTYFGLISYQIFQQLDEQIARGMQLSVACSEDVPFITEEEIKRETAGSFYGDFKVRSWQKACEQWPRAKVPASFINPVQSNIPTLIISGDIDPVTPPAYGADAASHLPNSLFVVARNTPHSFRAECLENLVAEFIAKGSAKGLQSSCSKEIERPPFVIKLP